MLNFIRITLLFLDDSHRRLSTGALYDNTSLYRKCTDSIYRIPADGINVQVGESPHAKTVNISRAALGATPALHRRLSEGARIINTDPKLFKIALQYIEQSQRPRPFASNPFDKLIVGSDVMLNLTKAWHLGYMLDSTQVQNRVIDTFSTCYRHFLKAGIRMSLSQEPFIHLRLHMGYHTRCERILFDFCAGLAYHGEAFRPEELERLPKDIAKELQHCVERMTLDSRLANFIPDRNAHYKVISADNTLPVTLHILPPRIPRRRTDMPPSLPSTFRPTIVSPQPPPSRSMSTEPVRPPFWPESPLQQRRR
jgi:hypothetical protein